MTELASPSLLDERLTDIVASHPQTARALDGLGIDYCCHGNRTLLAAAREAGIDPRAAAAALQAVEPAPETEWASLSTIDLVAHIVGTHHRYLRTELPALEKLAEKVHTVHGERHHELFSVARLVNRLRTDLLDHLDKEERTEFPRLMSGLGLSDGELAEMRADHEAAGALLVEIRRVTDGFEVPVDSCASYRSLYDRLEALEYDTHVHIHKENHRLFSTIEIEEARA